MKYIRQFCIIMAIVFAGELTKLIIPLPVPASIYGLLLLLAGLQTNIIPLASVKETGEFLVQVMPIMFLPATIGLMTSFDQLKEMLLPVLAAIFITTPFIMGLTGWITQKLLKEKGKRNDE